MRIKLFILVLLSGALRAEYSIGRYSMSGGGGTSSGGTYIVTGTIAQAEAGYSEGGVYEVFSGFWPAHLSCVVDLADFANFALDWLQTGAGLAGDLYADENVNMADFAEFMDFWLYYCPYGWPLE